MTMERKNSNVVVHVRSDSGKELDALFHVIQSASAAVEQPSSNSLPMKLRKLPPSFFKQPTLLDPTKLDPDSNTGLTISHSRAHSSPASLTVPSSSAGPPNYSLHPVHSRTQSYDSSALFEENSQLPPGWEMRTSPTGQPYFMNHYEQVTTWQDPRKSQSTSNLNSSNGLPDGWEQAITPEGEVYYINHLTRTTSWMDPRLAQCRTTSQQQQGILQPQRGGQQQADHRQKAMLERLQMEKEKLKKRQQQLLEQEILLKHGLLEDGGNKSLLGNLAREAALAQMPSHSQPDTTTSVHMRDESFDSGLGMSSTGGFGYNTDVELNSGGGTDTQMYDANYNSKEISSRPSEGRSGGSGRLPDFFDSIPGTNVDYGTIEGSENTPSSMETDDLGVGLDLNTDILNDVESVLTPNMSKIPDPNFLTWL